MFIRIIEKTAGPDRVRVKATWGGDQGGHGSWDQPWTRCMAQTVSCLSGALGGMWGGRSPSRPQAVCPARAHMGEPEERPAADREHMVLAKESRGLPGWEPKVITDSLGIAGERHRPGVSKGQGGQAGGTAVTCSQKGGALDSAGRKVR